MTGEDVLTDEFQRHEMTVPPHLVHDLHWFADLFVGDSQTTATEAANSGAPAVRSNDFVGDGDMGTSN